MRVLHLAACRMAQLDINLMTYGLLAHHTSQCLHDPQLPIPHHQHCHPTSLRAMLTGLDARAASIVMAAVKNIALNNRTVFVTIHQPSINIFESFDFLLLLQRGGRVTYFGPLGHHSKHLIHYLESVPGGCAAAGHAIGRVIGWLVLFLLLCEGLAISTCFCRTEAIYCFCAVKMLQQCTTDANLNKMLTAEMMYLLDGA